MQIVTFYFTSINRIEAAQIFIILAKIYIWIPREHMKVKNIILNILCSIGSKEAQKPSMMSSSIFVGFSSSLNIKSEKMGKYFWYLLNILLICLHYLKYFHLKIGGDTISFKKSLTALCKNFSLKIFCFSVFLILFIAVKILFLKFTKRNHIILHI